MRGPVNCWLRLKSSPANSAGGGGGGGGAPGPEGAGAAAFGAPGGVRDACGAVEALGDP